jgi:hypothetical protein
MPKFIKQYAAGALGLALAVFLCVPAARAEIEVLESSVADYTPGSVLKDSARVKLPAQATLRVLITGTGTTKTLKGPYEGTVAAYKERRSLFNRFKDPARKEPVIGAYRGAKPAPKPKGEDQ